MGSPSSRAESAKPRLKPMLAEQIEARDLPAYCANDLFVFEQKVDGHRRLTYVEDGAVVPLSKQGKATDVPAPVAATLREALPEGKWALDGELLDGVLYVFDLPECENIVTPDLPYEDRRRCLEMIFQQRPFGRHVRLLPVARTPDEKAALASRLLQIGGEGVMVKNRSARYVSTRTRGIAKAKFIKTVDVVVMEVNREGKASLGVGLYDGQELRDVGAVTVNNASLMKATVGDVIEIEYLYASTDRRIVQPAKGKLRTDKLPEECSFDQLRFTDRTVLEEI